jgi:hypothetical protein
LLFTLGLILIPVVVMAGVAAAIYNGVDTGVYSTQAAYDEAQLAADDRIQGIGVVLGLLYLAVLCPKVGYRWWDAFFLLIPFYGIFFLCRIAWRAANLPHVDWRSRGAPAAGTPHPAPA